MHRKCIKVDLPNLVTYLDWTPIFEWYVVICDSKNRYETDMCLKEIGLRAQNMITIFRLNSQHKWGDLYDYLMSTTIFTLILHKILV